MSESLLENYNPLYDVHLRQYFSLPHMQKHLRRMGLLDSNGVPVARNGNVESELYARHHAMMEMMLKNRERILIQLADLQKKYDAAEKVEIYRKIRSGMTNSDELKRNNLSRSLSRPHRAETQPIRSSKRRRASSTSFEDTEIIKRIETTYEQPTSAPVFRNTYDRLAANAFKYQFLHKLDDTTLHNYKDSLLKQLQKLQRFRDVSFGPYSFARHQPSMQTSWFFRRRSLPPLTATNTLHDPTRSLKSLKPGPNGQLQGSSEHKKRQNKSQSPRRHRRMSPAKRIMTQSTTGVKLPPLKKEENIKRSTPPSKPPRTQKTSESRSSKTSESSSKGLGGILAAGAAAVGGAIAALSASSDRNDNAEIESQKQEIETAEVVDSNTRTPTPKSEPETGGVDEAVFVHEDNDESEDREVELQSQEVEESEVVESKTRTPTPKSEPEQEHEVEYIHHQQEQRELTPEGEKETDSHHEEVSYETYEKEDKNEPDEERILTPEETGNEEQEDTQSSGLAAAISAGASAATEAFNEAVSTIAERLTTGEKSPVPSERDENPQDEDQHPQEIQHFEETSNNESESNKQEENIEHHEDENPEDEFHEHVIQKREIEYESEEPQAEYPGDKEIRSETQSQHESQHEAETIEEHHEVEKVDVVETIHDEESMEKEFHHEEQPQEDEQESVHEDVQKEDVDDYVIQQDDQQQHQESEVEHVQQEVDDSNDHQDDQPQPQEDEQEHEDIQKVEDVDDYVIHQDEQEQVQEYQPEPEDIQKEEDADDYIAHPEHQSETESDHREETDDTVIHQDEQEQVQEYQPEPEDIQKEEDADDYIAHPEHQSEAESDHREETDDTVIHQDEQEQVQEYQPESEDIQKEETDSIVHQDQPQESEHPSDDVIDQEEKIEEHHEQDPEEKYELKEIHTLSSHPDDQEQIGNHTTSENFNESSFDPMQQSIYQESSEQISQTQDNISFSASEADDHDSVHKFESEHHTTEDRFNESSDAGFQSQSEAPGDDEDKLHDFEKLTPTPTEYIYSNTVDNQNPAEFAVIHSNTPFEESETLDPLGTSVRSLESFEHHEREIQHKPESLDIVENSPVDENPNNLINQNQGNSINLLTQPSIEITAASDFGDSQVDEISEPPTPISPNVNQTHYDEDHHQHHYESEIIHSPNGDSHQLMEDGIDMSEENSNPYQESDHESIHKSDHFPKSEDEQSEIGQGEL